MWFALPLLTLHLAAMPAPSLQLVPRLTLGQAVAPAEPPVEAPPVMAPPLPPAEPLVPPTAPPPLVSPETPSAMDPPPPALVLQPRLAASEGYKVAEGAIAAGVGLGSGLVLGLGTIGVALLAPSPSGSCTFFCISDQQAGILAVGALLTAFLPPLLAALSVVFFADAQHLTSSTLGAILGAYAGAVVNLAVGLIFPPLWLALPITVAAGAVIGANAFAPAPDVVAPPLLSPTARTVVASW